MTDPARVQPNVPFSDVKRAYQNLPNFFGGELEGVHKSALAEQIATTYEMTGEKGKADELRRMAKADMFQHSGTGRANFDSDASGNTQHTAPPNARLQSQVAEQGFAELGGVRRISFGGRTYEDMKDPNTGETVTAGRQVEDVLRRGLGIDANGNPTGGRSKPELTQKVMSNAGMTYDSRTNKFYIKAESEGATFMSSTSSAQTAEYGNFLGGVMGSKWMIPMAALGGGVGGLVGMLVAQPLLKQTMGGANGNLLGMSAAFNSSGYLKSPAGAAGFAGGAFAAQAAGFHGLAFSMRRIMRSYAEDFKDQSMIGMIQNENIPIEDLIFMFMAYMADKYETKLREKMEETALAEKKERERERKKDQARLLGGIASVVPGVGPIIGSGIEMIANEQIRIKDALDGNMKSATLLMQEVQMLMHKWKQLNEMLSNLMKALHDMAMTPIRNLR